MKTNDLACIFPAMIYRFDRFQLDIDGGTLDGPSGHVSLPEKPFRLLSALVAAEGRVLGKDEAMGSVWPGQIVSDASLATALKAVRDALGDSGEAQRLIETVKGRGIRMAVPVVSVSSGRVRSPSDVSPPPSRSVPPTLAVLRFTAQSDSLGRAIPADLIAALSVSRELRVIARGSAFRFLSGVTPPSDLSEHCGADYVLSGHIEGARNDRRVVIELADARTDTVVWTSEFDLAVGSDGDLSEQLRRKLVPLLLLKISGHESTLSAQKPTDQLTAWEAYHLGVNQLHRLTPDGNLKAIEHLQRAVVLDPEFSSAYAAMSDAAFGMAFSHFSADRSDFLNKTIEWADRAIAIDPENALSCTAKGRSFWLLKAPSDGLHFLDRALEIDPNSVHAVYSRGVLQNFLGLTGATVADMAVAMQNSPLDPRIYSMRGHLGVALMQQDDHQTALEWAEQSVRSPRMEPMVIFVATVAASLAGERERARHWKSELARVAPQITPGRFFESMPLKDSVQKTFTKAFDSVD